jgi:ABC-type lipoprotein release transport system permease subunit
VFFGIVFFNILATMIAMVLDRRQEVGIHKAMD